MQEAEAVDFVWKLIGGIQTAMMTTHCGDDHVRARPMRGYAKPAENAIWFVTDQNSVKQHEVERQSKTGVTYADVKGNSYVSLSGRMDVVAEPERVTEIWNEELSAYYKGGPPDREIALLRFTPEFGEYWDAPGNPIILAIKFVEAKLTGERPALGTHAKVELG